MTKQCSECVSGVCQPCVRCVSASPKSKIRGQPETQNPPPPRNHGGTPPSPRHPGCEKWCRAHFFYDASDEKPVSPCVARVIKFHFRRCSIRKACVGDPTYLLCFNLLLSLFCEKHGAKCLCQFANGRLLCFNLPPCTRLPEQGLVYPITGLPDYGKGWFTAP